MTNWFYKLAAFEIGNDFGTSSDEQIWAYRRAAFEAAGDSRGSGGLIRQLMAKFPSALFQTTLRQRDWVQHHGPKLVFVIFEQDVNPVEFQKYQQFMSDSGVEVRGYIRRSGFDNDVFVYDGDKLIPGELESWAKYDHGGGDVVPNFEDGRNLIGLIWNNTILHIDKHLMWKKHVKNPRILQVLEHIDENDIDVKQGEQLLMETGILPFGGGFFQGFREWWWGSNRKSGKSRGDMIQGIEQAMGDFQNEVQSNPDQYVYNISMNPTTDGKGKEIDLELLQQAFEIHGDFNVLVRYQAGRIIYPASKIAEWAAGSDDMSYNFFNQLGGIRDMYIAR